MISVSTEHTARPASDPIVEDPIVVPDTPVILSTLPHESMLDRSAVRPAAEHLARMLALEPCILKERNTIEAIEAQLLDHPCLIAYDVQGLIVGFATCWLVDSIPHPLYELGSVWIAEAHRGSNLSHRLYQAIIELRKRVGPTASVFSITTNPRAIRLGREVGFQTLELDDWFRFIPERLTCGPCDLVPPDEKPTCPKRCTSCQLRLIL